MRLNKQCQELRRQNTSHLEQCKALKEYLDDLKKLNKAMRDLVRARKNGKAATKVDSI